MVIQDKIRAAMELKRVISDLEHELRMRRGDLQDIADNTFLHEVVEFYPHALTVNWRLLEAIVEGYPYRDRKKR